MKKLFIILLASIGMLTSCFEDHSTLADELIPDITIQEFPQSEYSFISFAGNYLDIEPTILTQYPEDQLQYEWRMIDNTALSMADDADTYEPELIAVTKNLHYNIKLSPGSYIIYLKVKAQNGYSVTRKTSLYVTTQFSDGFYILKETPQGDTDIDMAHPTKNIFLQDILMTLRGAPMDGAPEAISTTISQGYIDDDTNQTGVSNVITVTTQKGEISVMRTSDLKEVFTASNLLFTQFDEDEKPYKLVQCMWSNVLMTNKGIRSQYQSELGKGESGKYGITNGIPTDRYAAFEPNSSYLFLWDAGSKNVVTCDYNGTVRYGSKEDNALGTLNVYDCLFIGYSKVADRIVYVLRHRMGTIWLMTIQAAFSSGWHMDELKPIRAYAPNCSAATKYALCATEATVLYGVADGKLWAYDYMNNLEKQIKPLGIADDERITYVSDQWNSAYSSENDYLIIGTQKDENYTLRFYSNFGGLPDGEPLYTVSGKGTVRGIRFTGNNGSNYNQAGLMD